MKQGGYNYPTPLGWVVIGLVIAVSALSLIVVMDYRERNAREKEVIEALEVFDVEMLEAFEEADRALKDL